MELMRSLMEIQNDMRSMLETQNDIMLDEIQGIKDEIQAGRRDWGSDFQPWST
jgi:hypothetical protein